MRALHVPGRDVKQQRQPQGRKQAGSPGGQEPAEGKRPFLGEKYVAWGIGRGRRGGGRQRGRGRGGGGGVSGRGVPCLPRGGDAADEDEEVRVHDEHVADGGGRVVEVVIEDLEGVA